MLQHQQQIRDLVCCMKKEGLKVKVVFVYIEEAHARDEWPIGKTVSVCDQPKNLTQRKEVAVKFEKEWMDGSAGYSGREIELVVDGMENEFAENYAAWPFRFYVVESDCRLGFIAQPEVDEYFAYNVETLTNWLSDKGWLPRAILQQ